MEQKSVLDRFVDALRGVQPANLSYQEAERRAIPGESNVQVSEEDLEWTDDVVRLRCRMAHRFPYTPVPSSSRPG